jgi:hypothetical protein
MINILGIVMLQSYAIAIIRNVKRGFFLSLELKR